MFKLHITFDRHNARLKIYVSFPTPLIFRYYLPLKEDSTIYMGDGHLGPPKELDKSSKRFFQ
jgi:hypothetical protein